MKREHFLIIGGNGGIGRALVKMLDARGHTVSVIGRKPAQTAELDSVHYLRLDLTALKDEPELLAGITSRSGKIDHLVFLQRFRGDGDDWSGEIATTLTASKVIVEYFQDKFTSGKGNGIVFANSIASSLVVENQPLSYHMAKSAIDQMIRYYAVKLGPRGIRVNGVSPGTVLKEASAHYFLDNPELMKMYQAITPLRRMGNASEIADVICYLCSAQSSFITGQTIIADGGVSLQWQETLALNIGKLLK